MTEPEWQDPAQAAAPPSEPWSQPQNLPAPYPPAQYPATQYPAAQYPPVPYPSGPYPAQYPPTAYGPGMPYGPPMMPLRTSGFAVAGMVLGILAVIGWWVPFGDILFAGVAIALSCAGMSQASRPGYTGKGMAIAGLVCGIVGAIPTIFVMLFFFGIFAAGASLV